MKLIMTKTERHANAAEHFGKDGGHVTLMECDVCGHLDWQSTATKEPKGLTVIPLRECPRCAEVLQRAPELANWVFTVIAKSQEDATARSP